MRILIYGINFSPELTGIGKYTGEMALWLTKQGHAVRMITTPPYYPAWRIAPGYYGWKYVKETDNKIVVFRCPLWVPTNPKTISRIIHLLSFSLSSLPVLFKQIFFWRPDAVVCIAPSFFCAPQTVLLSKLAGVKSWLHFQDFEICAMFGAGMAGDARWINKFAHGIQRIITRRFDAVSSISNTMCAKIDENNVSKHKPILLPNWVDIDFVTPAADRTYFRKKWNIAYSTKVVLYSGNLGKKQGLESLVDSAHALQHRKDLLFIIVGDGAHKAALVEYCEVRGLENIQFHPLQPYDLLPQLLRMADVHLVIQKRGAADAVLPSKLTSILSAGGYSIITAEPDTELGHIVGGNPGIATLIPPEDNDALTKAIVELCDNPLVGSGQVNQQARDFAVRRLGKAAILEQFERDLQRVVNG